MREYVCQCYDTTLRFNSLNIFYTIKCDNNIWKNYGRKPYIIIRKKLGKKYVYTYRLLSSALKQEHKTGENYIESRYGGFIAFGKKYDFIIVCTVKITGKGKVEFSVKAENESGMDIQAVYYPSAFDIKNPVKNAYTVDTMRQGMIIPDGWNKNRFSLFLLTKYWRKVNTGDCYMPFWGRVCNNAGYLAIIDTPFDATIFSGNGRQRSVLTSVNWISSLGKLSYERRLKIQLFDNCDYNTICKGYRHYLEEKGELVKIEEKIKRNENVKRLIGAPVLHTGIYSTVHPESKFYDKKNPENNKKLIASFDERCREYELLKQAGLQKLYIHTDGWGEMGYDNNHPYVLPPCPQAGGYDGMKHLCNTCDKLGYVFAIHDQYRDFYYSCKKFDISFAVEKIDGSHPFCKIWAGGPHTWLCASKSLDYLQLTHKELEEHGVYVKGVYLDVFSIMPGDECFSKNHRITRKESIECRGKCFDFLRGKGIIVSSEEPGAQMINYIDLVHHAPYAVRPQERGAGVGISVPLMNLVFHDCIFVPWIIDGIGGWGIPDGDAAKLHCILNAQTPYFEPYDVSGKLLPKSELEAKIAEVNYICKIQERLYNKELVSHKFLDSKRRIQQAVYSDGTVITVDFDKNIYEIKENTAKN